MKETFCPIHHTILDCPAASRTCSVSRRELLPGETFFSVLLEENGSVKRLDYAAEHWAGPPETFLGWWKTKVAAVNEKKARLAPNDVLINLFEELALQPENAELRYVLTLLLIRRRLFRYEREEENENGDKTLIVYAIKENAAYEVPVAMPNSEQLEIVQKKLAELVGD